MKFSGPVWVPKWLTASLEDLRKCKGGCPKIQLYPKEVTDNLKIEENVTVNSVKKGMQVGIDRGQAREQDSNRRPDFSMSWPSQR